MTYSNQAEKLALARSSLMLPHPEGEEASIAEAFHNCSLAFHGMDYSGLSDNARDWVDKIKDFMDTSEIDDKHETGKWGIKAKALTVDERIELSDIIDELAHWFKRQSAE